MQWIDASTDVQAALNRMQFELRLGSHRHRSLQDEYKASVGKALQFEILERIVTKDDPDWNLQDELDQAVSLWRTEYSTSGTFYEK